MTRPSWETLPVRRLVRRDDGDTQWRTGIGLVLLTGLLSLFVGPEPLAYLPVTPESTVGAATQSLWPPILSSEPDTRRQPMDGQNPPSTSTVAWEAVTAPVTERASVSSVGLTLASQEEQGLSVGRLLNDAEAMIRRYPWPTVLLGMAAGFLLARRVR